MKEILNSFEWAFLNLSLLSMISSGDHVFTPCFLVFCKRPTLRLETQVSYIDNCFVCLHLWKWVGLKLGTKVHCNVWLHSTWTRNGTLSVSCFIRNLIWTNTTRSSLACMGTTTCILPLVQARVSDELILYQGLVISLPCRQSLKSIR